ncbi:Uncharacterised protein [Mycobacteroides abscessus subsp. abscessus]|nr:Uncharacterised protein [Mycobacteroides abscessus subsp. abscessus]
MRRDVFLAAAETVVAVSSRYAGPWLILAVFLVAVAGLCVIDALARVLGSRNR